MFSNVYRDQEIPWHVCEVRCGHGHLLGLRRVMLLEWSEDKLHDFKLDAVANYSAALQEEELPSGCPVCGDQSLAVALVQEGHVFPELPSGWSFPAYAALASDRIRPANR